MTATVLTSQSISLLSKYLDPKKIMGFRLGRGLWWPRRLSAQAPDDRDCGGRLFGTRPSLVSLRFDRHRCIAGARHALFARDSTRSRRACETIWRPVMGSLVNRPHRAGNRCGQRSLSIRHLRRGHRPHDFLSERFASIILLLSAIAPYSF